MGVESFCSCSKDCGEGSFTFQQNNRSMNNSASKEKQNLNQLNQKPNLKLIDNFYRNNNLINKNYFSINSTNPILSCSVVLFEEDEDEKFPSILAVTNCVEIDIVFPIVSPSAPQ